MKVFHFSFKGSRAYQEDCLLVDNVNNIYAICDGVGGTSSGAQASRYTIDQIKKSYKALKTIKSAKELEEKLRRLHYSMLDDFNNLGLGQSLGTTIAVLVINDGIAYVANIGDTKIFQIQDFQNYWVSKDHSAVQELYDVGLISTQKDMLTHPYRNRITSSLSTSISPSNLLVNSKSFDLSTTKSKFIIASDGALEKWTNDFLIDHFNCPIHLLKNQWNLFEDLATYSRDNSSAILIF
jgi:PPM family protein phosphatase